MKKRQKVTCDNCAWYGYLDECDNGKVYPEDIYCPSCKWADIDNVNNWEDHAHYAPQNRYSEKSDVPCVRCGWCCTKEPCENGKWSKKRQECLYLSVESNKFGQRFCCIADKIMKTKKDKWNKMFERGCFCSKEKENTIRQKIIERLKKE